MPEFNEALLEVSVEVKETLRVIALHDSMDALEKSRARAAEEMLRQSIPPPGFEMLVDYSYAGDVGDALRAMAALAHYDYQESGTSIDPVIVNVNVSGETLNVVLRELAAQAGSSVSIDVYPERKRIHLIRRMP